MVLSWLRRLRFAFGRCACTGGSARGLGESFGHASTAITRATDEETRINEDIWAHEVRLVAPDGEQIGIRPLPDALQVARDMNLDLVEVAPNANPPVCRIMDYGKFKYEAAQRKKESRKKSSHAALKEMKYRPKIGSGDFGTKTTKVEKFLEDGHKVKVTVMFRGREVFHPELGQQILERVAESVSEIGKVDQIARLDGRNMTMVLSPDKASRQRRKAAADPADATDATEAASVGDSAAATEEEPAAQD